MIKKITLIVLVGCLFTAAAFSQCVPDSSITHNTPGIYPDSATGLPHAYVGHAYSTDVHFFVPPDTVYQNLPVTIVSIDVTGVTGLPPGFTYTCTPSNCVFPGGTNDCVLIQGPAPTTGMIGNYPLEFDLTIHGDLFGTPQTLLDVVDNYTIVIESTTGLWSLSSGNFAVKQNAPNPFSRYTNIPVNSKSSGMVSLKVTDILGNVVLFEDREVQKGVSNLTVDAAKFEAGIYLYTVSDGRNSVTRRMVVSGKNEF